MTTLQLDPENRTLRVTAELAGENAPIDFEIHYEVESTETGPVIVPRQFGSSREWIQLLGSEIVKSDPPRLAVPAGLPAVLLKLFRI